MSLPYQPRGERPDHQQFVREFDEWARTYDDTVLTDRRSEVKVFEGYEEILDRVAEEAGHPGDLVLDLGTGTGNLALRLLNRGLRVVAVDPSCEMRRQARKKLGSTPVLPGHFLRLPLPPAYADAAVSTYALHHLQDEAKVDALAELMRVLRPGGRVLIADICFADELARERQYDRLLREGRINLVRELEREYYTTLPAMEKMAARLGLESQVEQLTEWVWLWRLRSV